jgi:NAD(P)H-nitrite reductase large subunit
MAASMNIEVDGQAAEEIRELAALLKKTPEETAGEILANGMHMFRRYAFYKHRSETADGTRGLEILKRAGVGNPPDPGDELPEDLKYLLTERDR